ncbi:arachidonate 12-lipoxygenase 12R-type, partial [Biomphalaria glabrata]
FTHLLMESFDLATQRNLSRSHPVYKLLEPHFLYLMAINSLALDRLINEDGWVQEVMNYGQKGMLNLIVK